MLRDLSLIILSNRLFLHRRQCESVHYTQRSDRPQVAPLMGRFPRVKTLYLSFGPDDDDTEDDDIGHYMECAPVGARAPQLESLDISAVLRTTQLLLLHAAAASAGGLTALKHLCIDNKCDDENTREGAAAAAVIALVQELAPGLTSLNLGLRCWLEAAAFAAMVRSLKALRHLTVGVCCAEDAPRLELAGEELRTVKLSHANFTDVDVSGAANLRSVYLHDFEWSDGSLARLLADCWQLLHLRVEYVSLITPVIQSASLLDLQLESCHRMQTLQVTCSSLGILLVKDCNLLDTLEIVAPSLRTMLLRKVSGLKDVTLECCALKELILPDCKNLQHVTLDCPGLKREPDVHRLRSRSVSGVHFSVADAAAVERRSIWEGGRCRPDARSLGVPRPCRRC